MTDVFVSVAAYNDPDTPRTLRSMLDQASLDLRVCVVLQTDDAELLKAVRALPVEVLHVPLMQAKGPCWARATAQDLYDGEPWYYQCDAHMLFEPGWDAELVRQMGLVGDRSVMSSYQQALDDTSENKACVMVEQEFGDHGIRWLGAVWSLDSFGGKPLPARAVSGHSLFAPGRWVEDVPCDPRLYFAGEETSLMLRSWTAGYDLWHPCATICRHRYERVEGTTHWTHHTDWHERNERARRRVGTLYGWVPDGPPLGVYGLGTERSLAEFGRWSGISFPTKEIVPDADWRASK